MPIVRFIRNCNARLVLGAAMLAGAAIVGFQQKIMESGPVQVQTLAGALKDCESRSIKTPFGKLGCASTGYARHSGAALFVPVKKR